MESLEVDLKTICDIYGYPQQLLTTTQSFDMTTADVNLKQVEILDELNFHFLSNVTGNWNNHLPLLLLSLHLTNGDVIELGSGEGSTSLLRKFCSQQSRRFESYESDYEWSLKTGAAWVSDWDHPVRFDPVGGIWRKCGLLFVDHAPGEHRKVAVERMADKAEIIVIHDTEEGGAGDYGLDIAWPHFKYRLNYNRLCGGAGATAVSNTIDLNRFRGLSLGQYKFDDD